MDREAMTIDQFCFAHGICRATFYNLRKIGRGPREMRVGSAVRISREAAADWRQKMEAEAAEKQEAENVNAS